MKMSELVDDFMHDLYQQTEEYLERFVDAYKPEELSVEDFMSMFVCYYEIKDEGSYIFDNKLPRIFFNIRLKTPEELYEEIMDEG